MKLLLVIPPVTMSLPVSIQKIMHHQANSGEHAKYFTRNPRYEVFDLAKIGSWLKEKGCEVSAADMSFYTLKMVHESIRKESPDVIILESSSYQQSASFNTIFKFLNSIKKQNGNIKIIWGGRDPSFLYETVLLNCKAMDVVIVGEPEISISEVIDRWYQKGFSASLDGIRGIAFRNGQKVIKNEPRPLIKDLDILPYPAYDLFNIDKNSTLILISSIGCPYSCKFCYRMWREVREHSVDYLINEIRFFYDNYEVEKYLFDDEVFTITKEKVIEFCKEILKNKIDIKFSCYSRVNTISEEILEWLKKAGCVQIRYGVESGSPRILSKMNKKHKVEEIIKAFKMTKAHQIQTYALFLVGFPGETDETIEETIQVINTIKPDYIDAKLVRLFPGSDLYNECQAKGYIDDDAWLRNNIYYYTKDHHVSALNKYKQKIYDSFHKMNN